MPEWREWRSVLRRQRQTAEVEGEAGVASAEMNESRAGGTQRKCQSHPKKRSCWPKARALPIAKATGREKGAMPLVRLAPLFF